MSAFLLRKWSGTRWEKSRWVFPQGWLVTNTRLQNSCFFADATTVGNWCVRIADPALYAGTPFLFCLKGFASVHRVLAIIRAYSVRRDTL